LCRTSFKDVGKGWYNLAESDFETYRFSKLRRFLGLVRFGMEDSLRYLAEGSMAKFVAFMQVGMRLQAKAQFMDGSVITSSSGMSTKALVRGLHRVCHDAFGQLHASTIAGMLGR
jgi:hypothetical protein